MHALMLARDLHQPLFIFKNLDFRVLLSQSADIGSCVGRDTLSIVKIETDLKSV